MAMNYELNVALQWDHLCMFDIKDLYTYFPQKTDVREALTQADNQGETPIHRAAITASIEVDDWQLYQFIKSQIQ